MRHSRANNGDRSNALWGRGSRGESRSNALWGRGGRRAGVAVATTAVMFTFAAVALAGGGSGSPSSPLPGLDHLKSYVPSALTSAIQQNPNATYDVIVQGDKKGNSNGLYNKLTGDKGPAGAAAAQIRQQFNSIDGLEANLTGRQIA